MFARWRAIMTIHTGGLANPLICPLRMTNLLLEGNSISKVLNTTFSFQDHGRVRPTSRSPPLRYGWRASCPRQFQRATFCRAHCKCASAPNTHPDLADMGFADGGLADVGFAAAGFSDARFADASFSDAGFAHAGFSTRALHTYVQLTAERKVGF